MTSSPVDSGGPPVLGEYGGMVYDGAIRGRVDDVHRNELSAEWHHVQVRPHTLVLT